MRVTGHRGAVIAVLAALAMPVPGVRGAAPDPAQQVWNALTGMASALASADAVTFLSYFDKRMQGYDDIRNRVGALVTQYDIHSGIDPIENTGNQESRTLKVNWSMHLISHSPLEQVVQRQMAVTIRFAREGRRWKVVGFEPASALALPPRP